MHYIYIVLSGGRAVVWSRPGNRQTYFPRAYPKPERAEGRLTVATQIQYSLRSKSLFAPDAKDF